jgi:hypothetical protein
MTADRTGRMSAVQMAGVEAVQLIFYAVLLQDARHDGRPRGAHVCRGGAGTGRRMQAFVALLRPGQHVAASALHAYSIAPSPSASLCPHLTGRQLWRGPAPPAHSESCPAGCARWPPRSAGVAAALAAPRFGPAAGQARGGRGNRGRSRWQAVNQPAAACVCLHRAAVRQR